MVGSPSLICTGHVSRAPTEIIMQISTQLWDFKKGALRPEHIWEKTKLGPQQEGGGGCLRLGRTLRLGYLLGGTSILVMGIWLENKKIIVFFHRYFFYECLQQ